MRSICRWQKNPFLYSFKSKQFWELAIVVYGVRPVLIRSYKSTSDCQRCRMDLSRAVADKNHKLNFLSPKYWKQSLLGHAYCLLCRTSFDRKKGNFPLLNLLANPNVVKPFTDKLSSLENNLPDTFRMSKRNQMMKLQTRHINRPVRRTVWMRQPKSFHKLGSVIWRDWLRWKIHYMIHHLDHFPPNCGNSKFL